MSNSAPKGKPQGPRNELIYRAAKDLLSGIGDNNRQGIADTPERIAKAWCETWASGYEQDPRALLKQFDDGAENVDEMVFQSCIPFYSHCEHHLAPFFGFAYIGYIPRDRIVGLSKLSRLVDVFAHRLQVQERMCNQIADAFVDVVNPEAFGIVLQARHMCMESRGIRKSGTATITTALRGLFKSMPDARAEFMTLVQAAMQGSTP